VRFTTELVVWKQSNMIGNISRDFKTDFWDWKHKGSFLKVFPFKTKFMKNMFPIYVSCF